MVARKKSAKDKVYQLKISLKGVKPPIWRRVQVVADTTLFELHEIIQITMGWWDSHLHQFIIHGEYFGTPHPDYYIEVTDEINIRLLDVINAEKEKFIYEYDFGDSWEHVILVEKILSNDPKIKYPVCLKGKRSCPPEDCGGIWGYYNFLEIIQNPDHPEYNEMSERWDAGEFDPEAFDLDQINMRLSLIAQ